MFWRGDLSFSEREFNDVDGVILARLSYLPFELIMNQNSIKEITIAEMAKKVDSLSKYRKSCHTKKRIFNF